MLSSFAVYANCNLNNPNEVLDLVKNNHPEILRNHFKEMITNESVNISKQRPKPEFNFEYLKGDTESTSLSILHTVELGAKQRNRVNQALTQAEKTKWEIRDENEDLVVDAILKLYRLGQVFDLIPIYEESIQAFERIVKIKSTRKSLSPEEEVEKETLSMAISDYLLKVSKLKSEKNDLSRHLTFYVGEDCKITRSVLPVYSMNEALTNGSTTLKESARLKSAQENLKYAQTSLSVAQSEIYPNLKIGPVFEVDKTDNRSSKSYGLALSMDIPIFNGSKAKAAQGEYFIKQAGLNLRNIANESKFDNETWTQKFNAYRNSLKSISSRGELNLKHQKIEKLIERGVLSTAMVLESHRQIVEFTNTRFEFELGAVEALWNIYKLNGTILNNKL